MENPNNASFFWRKDESKPDYESQRSSDHLWNYHDKIRPYLLLIAKNKDGLESIGNYPETMKFPKFINEACLDMVLGTKTDGLERFFSIATGNNFSEIMIPTKHIIGEKNRVSSTTVEAHESLVMSNGAENIIGSFHSHPKRSSYKSIYRRILAIYTSSLSPADLYSPARYRHEMLVGVVEQNKETAVVFRSKESIEQEGLEYLPEGYRDQNSFMDYWLRTKSLVKDTKKGRILWNGKSEISPDKFEDLIWEINMDIAKKHNLALYRGHLNGYLGRFYPNSINTQLDDFGKELR